MTTFDNQRFAEPVVLANDGIPPQPERSTSVINAWAPPDSDRSLRQEQLVAHYINDLGERIDDDYVELVERLDDLTERVGRLESALADANGYECGDRLDELERAVDEFAQSVAPSVQGTGESPGAGRGLAGPSPTSEYHAGAPTPVDDPMARLALSLAEPDTATNLLPRPDEAFAPDRSGAAGTSPHVGEYGRKAQ